VSNDWTITRQEARELARRHQETQRTGGIPHADVERAVLADIERELRRMVAAYDGSEAQARELLEGLVLARESGLPDLVDELERELARRLLKTA
jgi:hypothetical protein